MGPVLEKSAKANGLSMPGGFARHRIKARHLGARLLVCFMYPDSLYAERALRAGAQGYINKENTMGRIVEAIRSVRDGRVYVSDEIAERLKAIAVPLERFAFGLRTETIHIERHDRGRRRQRIRRYLPCVPIR